MRRSPTPTVSAADRAPTLALGLLFSFTVLALVGYGTFGRNPTLLARFPQALGFYGASFHFFAQVHIWLAMGAMGALLLVRVRHRWIAAFVALYAVSLAAELLGTGTGIPFGAYRYTDALGARWFGHVPVVIPMSWFFMAVPAYALALRLYPSRGPRRVVLAAALLTAWDLALDPAMSRATAYWVWERPGLYYGMPLSNLVGWMTTGVALMVALELLDARRWVTALPRAWLATFYGLNLLLPLGMCALAGLWAAVPIALTAVALPLAAVRLLPEPTRITPDPRPVREPEVTP
ncbi:MAG TPA: carotenoid biosynthesis protein [Longimicrobiales bacterium]|nr:carotenoid biosynthesis protein [Longimicrobiales bacterium]